MTRDRFCLRPGPAHLAGLALQVLLALAGEAYAAAVAVGTHGAVFHSNTAGASFTGPTTIDTNVSLAGVWMMSDAAGVAVGNGNSIFLTGNGGTAWSPVTSPITTTYNDVMFPTSTTGYIAATSGNVLKTTNGGTSWTSQTTNSPSSLLALWFTSASNGVAVGSSGAIFRTTNGGSSWTNETTGSANLLDVHFADASNGFAVGAGGTILKTTNGGDTWSTVTSGTTVDLTGVWFTSATTGFVCGGDRVLRRTTDGGTNWSAVTLPTTTQQSGLFDVFFADPDTGIVVGSGVNAYRTIDGGTNWTVTNPDPTTSEVFQAVHLRRPPGPPPSITVTVSPNPAGRQFRVDGQLFTTTQTFTWESGSSHTLEAVTPQTVTTGERYAFTAWSGGSTSTSSSITVSPTANTTFGANFQRQFFFTMASAAGGSGSPASSWRNAGASVSIAASASTGYQFVAWAGSGSGSYTGPLASASVTMNGPITQTPDFDPRAITLTFQTVPSGRQVIVDGTTRTTPYVLQTTADVAHSLGVPSPQGEANGARLAYDRWDHTTSQSNTIDPLVSTTYTARFKDQYFLTTLAEPSHSGSLLPADGWYDAGAQVTLDPTPAPGWAFFLLTGTGSGAFTGLSDDRNFRCTMNGPITQTAYFSNATLRTIRVRALPPGPDLTFGSYVLGTDRTFLWPDGQVMQIGAPATQTAVATVKRWQYTSWSDGGARVHTVTPTANRTYTANFDVQFQLEMEAESGGTTNPPVGISWVDSNTVVTITALPDADHSFASWSGIGTGAYNGSNNPAQFTMRAKVKELARFDLEPRITIDPAIAGRKFVAAEPETIRWTANFASITPCMVEYKHATSATWTAIAGATPQTEFVTWIPPDSPQTSLSLRITWAPNPAAGDTLGTFQICAPYFDAGPTMAAATGGANVNSAAAGDVNGDGVPDLVLGLASGQIEIRRGTGSGGTGTGAFLAPTLVSTPSAVVDLDLGDLDRDGDLDIAVATAASSFVRTYLGDGTGAFAAGPIASVPGTSGPIRLADVTEDGLLDIVAVRGGVLGVSRANGTAGVWAGTFATPTTVASLATVNDFELADLDRDGLLDVATVGGNPALVAVHFGAQGPTPGTGGFGAARTLSVGGSGQAIELADFDGNRRYDALLALFGAPPVVLVDLGATGPSGILVARRDTVTTTTGYHFAAVADFDRDGHLDAVLAARTHEEARVFRGSGGGEFSFMTSRPTLGEPLDEILVHDWIEDGRPDLLVIPEGFPPILGRADHAGCRGLGGAIFLAAPDAPGLSFPIGSEMRIEWSRFQSPEAVNIELQRTASGPWETILRNVVHSPVSWTVTGPPGAAGRIRLRPVDGIHLSDLSANPFTITAPTVDAGEPTAVVAAEFAAPVPNPTRGGARFELALPVAADVRLDLFDVAGRRVRTVLATRMAAGRHAVAWDGRDDGGRRLAAGVYFARAHWDGFARERRVIRLD